MLQLATQYVEIRGVGSNSTRMTTGQPFRWNKSLRWRREAGRSMQSEADLNEPDRKGFDPEKVVTVSAYKH